MDGGGQRTFAGQLLRLRNVGLWSRAHPWVHHCLPAKQGVQVVVQLIHCPQAPQNLQTRTNRRLHHHQRSEQAHHGPRRHQRTIATNGIKSRTTRRLATIASMHLHRRLRLRQPTVMAVGAKPRGRPTESPKTRTRTKAPTAVRLLKMWRLSPRMISPRILRRRKKNKV